MKILITGANGQLGRELTKQYLEQGNIELLLTDIRSMELNIKTIYSHEDNPNESLNVEKLDITKVKEVYEFVDFHKPDVIINCAAHTAVDKCESDVDNAYKINAIGVKNLAEASYKIGAELVHISTDYVFGDKPQPNGDTPHTKGDTPLRNVDKPQPNGDTPHTEFDETNPETIYGKTKLQGEIFARTLNPRHYIIRTAWVYGDGNNFVRTMLEISKNNKSLKVVNDQTGSPTSTVDLASTIIKLVEDKNYGLFHCTCEGQCTWYEFAKAIFEIKNIAVEVVPCTTEEFPRPAKRPRYSVLRNYMLELTTEHRTRHWKEALQEYLAKVD